MEFQLSYNFKLQKMLLLKCYTQYASKFGKLSNSHRPGKGQFSFQPQRRVMPKNVQTTTQLHSFHMLARSCSKSSKLGFNSTWTKNVQMYKLDLKGKGTRDQIANIHGIIEKARKFQKTIYFCFIDYAKAPDCVDHNSVENSSREGNTRSPYLPPEKSVCRSRSNS